MSEILNIAGQRFGKLVVKEFAGTRSSKAYWLCECDCGKRTTIRSNSLRTGNTRSCGCFYVEAHTKHGQWKHPLYKVWHSMKQRCINPNEPGWVWYGGRGITLTTEWFEFEPFIKWALSEGNWKPGLQIDRIDNDAGYAPANCRFTTPRQNSRNTRRQKRNLPVGVGKSWKRFRASLTINGKKLHFGTWDTPEAAEAAVKRAEIEYGIV